jgi:hypothetical protein
MHGLSLETTAHCFADALGQVRPQPLYGGVDPPHLFKVGPRRPERCILQNFPKLRRQSSCRVGLGHIVIVVSSQVQVSELVLLDVAMPLEHLPAQLHTPRVSLGQWHYQLGHLPPDVCSVPARLDEMQHLAALREAGADCLHPRFRAVRGHLPGAARVIPDSEDFTIQEDIARAVAAPAPRPRCQGPYQ